MIVYALIDPRNGLVRYVGKTHRSAQRRLRRHLAAYYLRGNTHKERWIRALLREGREPSIVVLERCASGAELCVAERRHIAAQRAAGARLTNATDGGDGVPGWTMPEAAKAKLRAALTGRPRSLEHRHRIGLASRGRVATAETRARLREARRRKPPVLPRLPSESNPRAKLTVADVTELRRLRGIVSQTILAKRYGVSKTAIRYAQKGRNWATVPGVDLRVREFPA